MHRASLRAGCGAHKFIRRLGYESWPFDLDRIASALVCAFLYSCLRLLLDLADVRLRVRDPAAELRSSA